ncbi:alpha/beta fold hydrolase [Planotetraspora mira]|uniref:Alpha/beta hydrolase n=1 Tax=Planotetraspora mira TaxID=58121 RepID=A0A8J3X9P9_9ACTN|nr:hypothetical protein [Planotetraspora mira]GII32646.1 hypothetical protein Pmi06nite_60880 [Planotetraspora mira]
MGTEHVTALVYVAAFVPGSGEAVGALVANPAAAQEFMATRANATVRVVEGASHMVFVSHPDVMAAFIQRAAAETAS